MQQYNGFQPPHAHPRHSLFLFIALRLFYIQNWPNSKLTSHMTLDITVWYNPNVNVSNIFCFVLGFTFSSVKNCKFSSMKLAFWSSQWMENPYLIIHLRRNPYKNWVYRLTRKMHFYKKIKLNSLTTCICYILSYVFS